MNPDLQPEVLKAPKTGGIRFAPSPTGRFHMGNLRTAWISHLWARHLGKPWVIRFEDIDQPRVLAGAQEQQLEDLRSLGLEPDIVLVQSHFRERHWRLLLEGIRTGQVYPCDCSRKEVQTALSGIASAPHDGLAPVYTGRCRTRSGQALHAAESLAWRFRMPLESGQDDFIVARSAPELDANDFPDPRRFIPAYHWACAIDDFDGDYDLLVRSSDLASAAHVQRAIQKWLSLMEGVTREPAIFHTSLVVQNDGHRLEKRTKGVTLPELHAAGLSNENVCEIFDRSFDRSLLKEIIQASAVFGESQGTVSLATLDVSHWQ